MLTKAIQPIANAPADFFVRIVMVHRKKMKYLLTIIITILPLSIAQAADLGYELTPTSIVRQIERTSPKAVVKGLYENGKAWDIVLSNVKTGKKEWLVVAVKLRPGTDAGASSMLDVAMFMAIENSPELVMRYSTIDCCNQGMFSLVFVCSSNFLIDYPLDFESLRIVQRKKKALQNIKSKELYRKRDKCIALLEKEIAKIQEDLKQQAIEKK